MKQKIVQLSDYEYDQLVEKANAKQENIESLAEKYYQERGVFRIDIKMGVQDKYNGDFIYYTNVFSCENGLYKSGDFKPIITEKGRRKIEKIISHACEETFYNKFGDAIKFKNVYADALKRFAFTRWICYLIAFSGWGAATALLI